MPTISPQKQPAVDNRACFLAHVGAVATLVLVSLPAANASTIQPVPSAPHALPSQQDAQQLFQQQLWSNATSGVQGAHKPVPPPKAAAQPAATQLRVQQLVQLQSSLGLPLQGLAETLNISRPQLYKWLDANNDVNMQSSSRLRLNQILELAQYWDQQSPKPLNAWLKQSHQAATLLGLLKADTLLMDDIRGYMQQAASELAQAPRSASQKMRDAGFTRRISAWAQSDDA